jgi:hypothetical protein
MVPPSLGGGNADGREKRGGGMVRRAGREDRHNRRPILPNVLPKRWPTGRARPWWSSGSILSKFRVLLFPMAVDESNHAAMNVPPICSARKSSSLFASTARHPCTSCQELKGSNRGRAGPIVRHARPTLPISGIVTMSVRPNVVCRHMVVSGRGAPDCPVNGQRSD